MKHKQAYIKLASLRLAINYVLRNRSMTKSASEWTNPLIGAGVGMGLGYLLSPEKHKLLGTLGGGLLGGATGYGFDKLREPKPFTDPARLRKDLSSIVNDLRTKGKIDISPEEENTLISFAIQNSLRRSLDSFPGSSNYLEDAYHMLNQYRDRIDIGDAAEVIRSDGKNITPYIVEDAKFDPKLWRDAFVYQLLRPTSEKTINNLSDYAKNKVDWRQQLHNPWVVKFMR